MESRTLVELGLTLCFGLSSLGAVIGVTVNAPAVIGAWKKSALNNRPAPFIMVIFAATCMTNIIYGYIAMDAMANSVIMSDNFIFFMSLTAGICIGMNSYIQAMICANAADAFGETGRNFGNYMMVVGVVETFALFIMVFVILIAG
ncbi:MAG: V-type ATP synthase subunit K [Treponema sp.]|nr:V-type ATP synthase subunit K [Treponema sp.]